MAENILDAARCCATGNAFVGSKVKLHDAMVVIKTTSADQKAMGGTQMSIRIYIDRALSVVPL